MTKTSETPLIRATAGTTRPIAVTGRAGRLGSALVDAARMPTIGWQRPDFDLDRPESFRTLLERDQPRVVIHAAAMTNVDACAREPDAAMRRNGDAVATLARECRSRATDLVVLSTNEVFDGERSDGQGYREDDEPRPRNAYGMSKLAGEEAARAAFGAGAGLLVVRTAWVYGGRGRAFPEKIVAAADRLEPGVALPVVDDEVGSPTLVGDLALAILALIDATDRGTYHLVNGGSASRYEWAARVLKARRPDRPIRPLSRAEFERASSPPPWTVLDASRAAATGVTLRSWEDAFEAYLADPSGPG